MSTKTSSEQWEQFQKIVAKAREDTDFKKRLLAEPETVVKEHGLEVPNGVHFKLTENPDQNLEMTFWKDSVEGELSEEELKSATGGKICGAFLGSKRETCVLTASEATTEFIKKAQAEASVPVGW